MGSQILHVVIDERLQLERIEDASFIQHTHQGAGKLSTGKVIRDYLYSTEVYELN